MHPVGGWTRYCTGVPAFAVSTRSVLDSGTGIANNLDPGHSRSFATLVETRWRVAAVVAADLEAAEATVGGFPVPDGSAGSLWGCHCPGPLPRCRHQTDWCRAVVESRRKRTERMTGTRTGTVGGCRARERLGGSPHDLAGPSTGRSPPRVRTERMQLMHSRRTTIASSLGGRGQNLATPPTRLPTRGQWALGLAGPDGMGSREEFGIPPAVPGRASSRPTTTWWPDRDGHVHYNSMMSKSFPPPTMRLRCT